VAGFLTLSLFVIVMFQGGICLSVCIISK